MTQNDMKDLWSAIDADRKRDRRVAVIARTAWIVTAAMLLIYGGYMAYIFSQFMSQYEVGMVPMSLVLGALQPLVIVIGSIALLVAVLATIGTFVRQRTATLAEIQARLAALETAVSKMGE